MVVIISAVLLVELVNFIWIGCPHVPAALDVKHHIVGLAFYLDQSHLGKLKKEASVVHLWCYLIQKFDVSIAHNYSQANATCSCFTGCHSQDSDKVCQIMTVEKKPSVANFEVMSIKGRRVFKKRHYHFLLAYLAAFSFLNVQAQTQVSVKKS